MISTDYADEEYIPVENMTVSEDGYFTVDGKDVLAALLPQARLRQLRAPFRNRPWFR